MIRYLALALALPACGEPFEAGLFEPTTDQPALEADGGEDAPRAPDGASRDTRETFDAQGETKPDAGETIDAQIETIDAIGETPTSDTRETFDAQPDGPTEAAVKCAAVCSSTCKGGVCDADGACLCPTVGCDYFVCQQACYRLFGKPNGANCVANTTNCRCIIP